MTHFINNTQNHVWIWIEVNANAEASIERTNGRILSSNFNAIIDVGVKSTDRSENEVSIIVWNDFWFSSILSEEEESLKINRTYFHPPADVRICEWNYTQNKWNKIFFVFTNHFTDSIFSFLRFSYFPPQLENKNTLNLWCAYNSDDAMYATNIWNGFAVRINPVACSHSHMLGFAFNKNTHAQRNREYKLRSAPSHDGNEWWRAGDFAG